MVDSDNVLLLRAAWEGSGFDLGPQATSRSLAPGVVQVGIASFRHPVDDAALRYFSDEIEPLLEQAGARMLACLITEHSVNTFPALPVREGENVLTWFAGFPSFQAAAAGRESTSLERAVRGWPGMTGLPEIRLLAPTGWSRLTGNSGTGFASLRLSRSPA
jgi:hypothetical protein